MAIDRPRGILSEADRKYLANPEEYSDQAAYERRQAITERVREALNDFPLLVSALDEDLRGEAFAGDTVNSLPSAIAFLYLGITDIVEPKDAAQSAFENTIGDGIRAAYHQRGHSLRSVGVDIEIKQGEPLAELLEKDELSFAEVYQLSESGFLSGEESAELLGEALLSGRVKEDLDALPNIADIEKVSEGSGEMETPDEINFRLVENEDGDGEIRIALEKIEDEE